MNVMWEKKWKRRVSCILAAALTVTACLSGAAGGEITAYAESYGKGGTVRELTSQQLVEDMGLGYNIGNTFDSIGSFITADTPQEYERGWGNEPVTRHFIDKVKEGGFKTIRLPVSWAQWLDESGHVDPVYMEAVREVVDWCMEDDMYVILNIHHDGGEADTSWIRRAGKDYEGTSKRYETVWTQIGEAFRGYGDHLIFESMNEVFFPDVSMSRQYEILNGLNQTFVNTIRATGGNNQTRHLLIAGYNTDIKNTCDRRFIMPEDPAGHVILSIHYYSPSPFCVADKNAGWCTPQTVWGTEEDLEQVGQDLDKLGERFISKGIPVIIGEYGVLTEDEKDLESVHSYLSKVPELILERGMCPVLWDTSNAGDMKTIERITGEFYDPVVKANYQALSKRVETKQINKKQFEDVTYKEIAVPISPGGWVSLASFEPSKIVGIQFEIACSSSWDSYGGGGIYLDGWENTVQWQFNSVSDQVTHMFSEEERSRLQDQIGIFFWYTDESQGGSHRTELSVANNQITLLYREEKAAAAVGAMTSMGGGGARSGGSGGGSRGSGGSSLGEHSYQFSIKQDRASAPEGDTQSGVQRLSLAEFCDDYQVGDTVSITVRPISDGGYSFAVQAIQEGAWTNSDSWGPSAGKSVSWECTPDDGNAAIYLWYLEGSYFLFNVEVKVTKKAAVFPAFEVSEGSPAVYDASELIKQQGIPANSVVRLTFSTEEVSSPRLRSLSRGYSGEISMWDAGGFTVKGLFDSDNSKVTLIGKLADGTVSIQLDEGSKDVRITGVKASYAEQMKGLAELQSRTWLCIPAGLLNQCEAVSGSKPGVRLYFDYEGDAKDTSGLSATLLANGDWSGAVGNDQWIIKSDQDGSYIDFEYTGAQNLTLACWYLGSNSFQIKKIVRVNGEESFSPIIVAKGSPLTYDYTELLKSGGISQGSRVRLLVRTAGEGSYSGEASMTDSSGLLAAASFRMDSPVGMLAGAAQDNKLIVKVSDDSESEQFTITEIQVEAADEDNVVQLLGTGHISIPSGLFEDEGLTGENRGARIYYEYDGDIKNQQEISLNLNCSWSGDLSNEKWTLGSDENGNYIEYPYSGTLTALDFWCWYMGNGPLRIIKVVSVEREPSQPPVAEEELEVTVTADENGQFYVPDEREEPIGIRFLASGASGCNLLLDGDWGKSVWLNIDSSNPNYYFFPDGTEFESIKLSADSLEVSQMTLLYWLEEDAEAVTDEDGNPVKGEFELPDYRVPVGVIYHTTEGNEDTGWYGIISEKWQGSYFDSWSNGLTYRQFAPDSTDSLAFSQSNLDTLEEDIMAAKAGGVLPRLKFNLPDSADYYVDSVTFYFNTEEDDGSLLSLCELIQEIPKEAVLEEELIIEEEVLKEAEENKEESSEEAKGNKESSKEPEGNEEESSKEPEGNEEEPSKEPEGNKEEPSEEPEGNEEDSSEEAEGNEEESSEEAKGNEEESSEKTEEEKQEPEKGKGERNGE